MQMEQECNKQQLQHNVNNECEPQIRSKTLSNSALAGWNQFKMKFRWSCHIFFSLFFIAQLNSAGSKKLEEEQLLLLQQKVENLVEKIVNFIQDYYEDAKADLKCIPECVSDDLMESLKSSIDCVEENEKNFTSGKIQKINYSKNFLKCFSQAKKEIQETIKGIDTSIDYCPENTTEKTYQINVTTTFTKTFRINIKNGVEMLKKEIELAKDTKHCFDNKLDEEDLVGGEREDGNPEDEAEDKSKEEDNSEVSNDTSSTSEEETEPPHDSKEVGDEESDYEKSRSNEDHRPSLEEYPDDKEETHDRKSSKKGDTKSPNDKNSDRTSEIEPLY